MADVKNPGGTAPVAVLTVCFGTRYIQSGEAGVGAVEAAIARKFPEYEVRRAYMSRRLAGMINAQSGQRTDTLFSALERGDKDGIRGMVVQPVFVTDGLECRRLAAALEAAHRSDGKKTSVCTFTDRIFQYKHMRLALGKPLLAEEEDIDAAAAAVAGRLCAYMDGETAVCLMGHGTATGENEAYVRLGHAFERSGLTDYYTGVMKGEPGIQQILAALKRRGNYRKAVLFPLMVSAGVHVRSEMAGSRPDSWKTIMERSGYRTLCLMEGLGQIPAIQEIYALHVKEALRRFFTL